MYHDFQTLKLGFHGCEKSLARDIILGRVDMAPSSNTYDWLGTGIYFWENDPLRALEFAKETKQCKEPFVIGAVLDMGHCFDLTCRENLLILQDTWHNIVEPTIKGGTTLKPNKAGKKGENGELMLRFLDCYVINALHEFNRNNGFEAYDSVRGAFWEGEEIYATAGFREKNHIQICMCNPKRILGLFLPEGYTL